VRQVNGTQKDILMSDQDLPELIKQLVELDEEIRRRLDDLKKLVKRNEDLSDNQNGTDYIK
jgi:hypothetical protein